jgi:hypothetical protein
VKNGPIQFEDAVSALGEPKQTGRRIARESGGSVSLGRSELNPKAILGAERWFIWDCAGLDDEYDRFVSALLAALQRAHRSRSENERQLDDALCQLQRIGDDLFCVAVEDLDSMNPTTAVVALVNVCARHR